MMAFGFIANLNFFREENNISEPDFLNFENCTLITEDNAYGYSDTFKSPLTMNKTIYYMIFQNDKCMNT